MTGHPFTRDSTLGEVIDWLGEHAEKGVSCPACTQFVKVYPRRTITGAMAKILVAMRDSQEDAPGGWIHLPSLAEREKGKFKWSRGGDEAKLRYWKLIEAMPNAIRDDGSKRTGWWRLTPLGRAFADNRERVQKYARIFNNQVLELHGESVGIRDCLPVGFHYRETVGDQS